VTKGTQRETFFQWEGERVLITGAGGFVGAHLARQLLERGARVVCLLRRSSRINAIDLLGLRADVRVVEGEITDLPFLERLLRDEGIEAIFHLAAQSIIGTANESPLPTFETNLRGTYLLLEACRLSGIPRRIVVASSDKAYGHHAIQPLTEAHALLGLSPYAASKAGADLIARTFAETYQLPITVCRSANVYGPADLNFSRIVPGTFLSLLEGQAPVIRSDGTPVRQFIHVDDLVRGYLSLAELIGETAGEAFNFGGALPIEIGALVTQLVQLAGFGDQLPPRILLERKPNAVVDTQFLSAEKAANYLSWQEEIPLTRGLETTWEWYRDHLPGILPTLRRSLPI
jgi:CDP-glucose 4,6-dehydratase